METKLQNDLSDSLGSGEVISLAEQVMTVEPLPWARLSLASVLGLFRRSFLPEATGQEIFPLGSF